MYQSGIFIFLSVGFIKIDFYSIHKLLPTMSLKSWKYDPGQFLSTKTFVPVNTISWLKQSIKLYEQNLIPITEHNNEWHQLHLHVIQMNVIT